MGCGDSRLDGTATPKIRVIIQKGRVKILEPKKLFVVQERTEEYLDTTVSRVSIK